MRGVRYSGRGGYLCTVVCIHVGVRGVRYSGRGGVYMWVLGVYMLYTCGSVVGMRVCMLPGSLISLGGVGESY